MNELLVFQYLKSTIGKDSSPTSVEDFQNVPDNYKPWCYIIAYNVDDNFSEFSRTYYVDPGYWVVVKDNNITQFYQYIEGVFTAFDLETHEPIEYYGYDIDGFCIKYNYHTKEVMQYNCIINYDFMPYPEKQSLKDFEFKDNIIMYGEKPYGKIVYCVTEQGHAREYSNQMALDAKQRHLNFWKQQISIDRALTILKGT